MDGAFGVFVLVALVAVAATFFGIPLAQEWRQRKRGMEHFREDEEP
jgi:hypothetical protein